MILSLLARLLEILIGFAGGLAVGAGFVAFLTVLRLIPRLTQLSKTEKYLSVYSACVILGTLFGTYLSFTSLPFKQPFILLIIIGILHGVFNGMLAAALTEILNVFPIIFKRIRIEKYLLALLMALVLGKVFGSLFQWLVLVSK
ncbi:stage V sporulation protein AB [Virgibacillus sp. MSJ-26]|uniref:stage V sporulation protein AB n=1 Tax=Virgibacillus sp. MSJ-26 TaxID=2841522 RepID=UPI001C1132B0|nr:stage V sporulation protein AB [Virgibacillus sp. MSJ-26]MBU5466311.1 stage V sporulation protein AB [Virgibacillus sp. MSJ-26]